MKPNPEFLFFLDSDVIVPSDAITKLFFRARCYPSHDIFAGVYCLKNPSIQDPLIYGELGQGPFWDWAVGDILTTEQHGIGAVHMGLTMIRVSLFQRMIDAGLVHGDGTNDEDEPFFYTGNEMSNKAGLPRLAVGTEDIYFCHKAMKLGAKILVDTSVYAGHHDKASGISYGLPWEDGPWKRGRWLPTRDGKSQDGLDIAKEGLTICLCEGGNVRSVAAAHILKDVHGRDALSAGWGRNTPETLASLFERAATILVMQDAGLSQIPERFQSKVTLMDVGPDVWGNAFDPELQKTLRARLSAWLNSAAPTTKLALDIGAGGTRREWPGYRTYTTDIRADSKPDYVQDTRLLNLPDDHFDLIASSHHLEHIGRWDQGLVWKEIFRVLKPGGKIEHIVPNVEWAAAKIVAGEFDGHVGNVLYGAQESHGYEREFNTHFFGYTPAIAVALAESVGFVNVTTTSWKDNPDLGYNLIICGEKPHEAQPVTDDSVPVADAVALLEAVEATEPVEA